MNPLDLTAPIAQARAYFDAWNRHDIAAAVATFAPEGTYRDPTTPGPLDRAQLPGYMAALFEGFADFHLDYRGPFQVGGDEVHVPWLLSATHTGTFAGIPPTQRRVTLEGIDLMTTSPQGLRSVVGLFDAGTLIRALGINLVPQT
jgi:C-1 hydroxylase